MEMVNQRRKMLDAIESNAKKKKKKKKSDNFATKVISTENVEKKSGRSKKRESKLFLF